MWPFPKDEEAALPERGRSLYLLHPDVRGTRPPTTGARSQRPFPPPLGRQGRLEPLSEPFSPPAAGRGRGGVGPQEPTKGGVSRFFVPPPSLRLPDRLPGGGGGGLGSWRGLKPVSRPVLAAAPPPPPPVLPASSPSAARKGSAPRTAPRAQGDSKQKNEAEIGAWPGPWGLRPPGRFLTCSDHNYFLFNVKIVLYYLLNVT